MGTSEFDKAAAEILAKCGRHCCICRRFQPTMLQVHHIVLQKDGGTDDPDNLIAACLTCHSDVHTKRPFTRRFSADEQKMHRDAVFKRVADGTLVPPNDDQHTMMSVMPAATSASSANNAFVLTKQGLVDPPLSKQSVELLIAAANSSDGHVLVIRADAGLSVFAASRDFVESKTPREQASWEHAVQELRGHDLLSGSRETLRVTHRGFLLADALESLQS